MPKTGLTARQWNDRLHEYARGTYQFGRGEHPKDPHWVNALAKIKSCLCFRSAASLNPFGGRIECVCGYHDAPSRGSAACAAAPLLACEPDLPSRESAPRAPPPLPARQPSSSSSTSEPPPIRQPSPSTSWPASDFVDEGSTLRHPAPVHEVRRPPTPTPRRIYTPTIPARRPRSHSQPPSTLPSPVVMAPPPHLARRRPSPPRAHSVSPEPTHRSSSAPVPPSSRRSFPALGPPPRPSISAPMPPSPLPSSSTPLPPSPHPTSSGLSASRPAPGVLSPSHEDEPLPKRLCLGEPGSLVMGKKPTDFSLRLPRGWEQNMAAADMAWVGRVLFQAKGKLVTELKSWWLPPQVDRLSSKEPRPAAYHLRRLFLWMPRKMWNVEFHCTICPDRTHLWSKGVYRRIRLVLDLKDHYYLAGEYMSCSKCNATFLSWDHRMLDQLADGTRACFPVLLTRKYACDRAVVTLLRARTLGNTTTALQRSLHEVHSEEWLRKQLCYLSDCDRHRRGRQGLSLPISTYQQAPPFPPFPTCKWFLALYVRDAWARLPALLASATSVFGSVLKIDSTKKVCKKLQGAAANNATQVTNVGNERGEIVISILTASEGVSALIPMADGLVDRYAKAGQSPPCLLYTDRDCCSSEFLELFAKWRGLVVRLDICHFMRRLAGGCTTKSHPLYGTFMSQLSSCIFEWDVRDVELLMSAKKGEMVSAGIPDPSDAAVRKAVSKEELARHCRRRTRGAEKTVEMVESLLLSFSSAMDTLGVPLLGEEMRAIWEEQRQHVVCIQDPLRVALYTRTGHLTKGGVRLPVLRCARGSTSLQSFHLHLARFIPGTSASAVHFQVYLLDGITRWNASRASAAVQAPEASALRTFDVRLKSRINALSESLLGDLVFPHHRPPAEYTGELIGVEYLYRQCEFSFSTGDEDVEAEIGEGFEEVEERPLAALEPPMAGVEEEPLPPLPPAEDSNDEEEEGLSILLQPTCASTAIPPWDLPLSPPPTPSQPHVFTEAEDVVGLARVGRRTATTPSVSVSVPSRVPPAPLSVPPVTLSPPVALSVPPVSISSPPVPLSTPLSMPAVPLVKPEASILSRTTVWRHRVKGEENVKARRVYMCRLCNQPMAGTGHSQFRGQRYCPNAPGQVSREEWMAQRRAEATERS